jgi:hypothetical protein
MIGDHLAQDTIRKGTAASAGFIVLTSMDPKNILRFSTVFTASALTALGVQTLAIEKANEAIVLRR